MKTFDQTNKQEKKEWDLFLERRGFDFSDIEDSVRDIIREVREKGDGAVCAFTDRFDGVKLNAVELEISREALKEAFASVSPALVESMDKAKKNIVDFYSQNRRFSWEINPVSGAKVGEIWHPLDSVGLYIPGGTAPLISTVLMTALPAKVAGVRKVVAVTPPSKEGSVLPEMLAAFYLADVDHVFQIGGAQAIAALAYGTETIPKVDKIAGPGNRYVTAAKKMVSGDVGIDTLAGPSEVLIVADKSAKPAFIASDMLSQLEHDEASQAVLVTPEKDLIEATQKELKSQVKKLERQKQLKTSCEAGTVFVCVAGLDEAVEAANRYAPEHCQVMTQDPEKIGKQIVSAGAVFLGDFSPVATGDFVAGPSHVLPTGGAGRFSSGLSLDDFMKRVSLISYSREALADWKDTIRAFTQAEGLDAHQASVDIRLQF